MEDAIRKAKELLEVVAPYGLAEFEYTDGAVKIRFCHAPAAGDSLAAAVRTVQAASAAPRTATPQAPAAAAAPPKAAAPVSKYVDIGSPMVGTFYSAPAPDKPPYASQGEVVEKGQVVCIIEAMKLMNEIKAPSRGRIVKVLVDNAQPVTKDQVLFQLDPAG